MLIGPKKQANTNLTCKKSTSLYPESLVHNYTPENSKFDALCTRFFPKAWVYMRLGKAMLMNWTHRLNHYNILMPGSIKDVVTHDVNDNYHCGTDKG